MIENLFKWLRDVFGSQHMRKGGRGTRPVTPRPPDPKPQPNTKEIVVRIIYEN